ncbi:hypothetical protein T12_14949 [Trichinella patagoniensis]|uniref:Uncharacterized protein n=1 Tax=Trichinella patagoniensis TaxID=990121 RepID=A0A0V0YR61_9BILA|nr:hypothetical protein T12_14949 [Trichinella patagoniensis]
MGHENVQMRKATQIHYNNTHDLHPTQELLSDL